MKQFFCFFAFINAECYELLRECTMFWLRCTHIALPRKKKQMPLEYVCNIITKIDFFFCSLFRSMLIQLILEQGAREKKCSQWVKYFHGDYVVIKIQRIIISVETYWPLISSQRPHAFCVFISSTISSREETVLDFHDTQSTQRDACVLCGNVNFEIQMQIGLFVVNEKCRNFQ